MLKTRKKKGFVSKFLSLLSGKPQEDNPEQEEEKQGRFAPGQKDPTDIAFVKNFTASGGKFLYCEKENEAYSYIQNIMEESGLQTVFCHNPNLTSILHKSGVNIEDESIANADAFCSDCEHLISFNGGIMITARQTMGKKLSELPETFITIARTSQITESLRSGLAGIRVRYHNNLPSQITTLQGPERSHETNINQPADICSKEIYLLLLEDQN